ncbi:MAG: hypothetical protein R6T98_16645 [Desulfatiglandales bacterium]
MVQKKRVRAKRRFDPQAIAPLRRRRIGIHHFHPRPPRLSESDGGQEGSDEEQKNHVNPVNPVCPAVPREIHGYDSGAHVTMV